MVYELPAAYRVARPASFADAACGHYARERSATFLVYALRRRRVTRHQKTHAGRAESARRHGGGPRRGGGGGGGTCGGGTLGAPRLFRSLSALRRDAARGPRCPCFGEGGHGQLMMGPHVAVGQGSPRPEDVASIGVAPFPMMTASIGDAPFPADDMPGLGDRSWR